MFLQACLGLSIDAPKREICFRYPLLPPSLQKIKITDLHVGTAKVDLLLERHGRDVGVTILDRQGEVEVAVKK